MITEGTIEPSARNFVNSHNDQPSVVDSETKAIDPLEVALDHLGGILAEAFLTIKNNEKQ